MESAYDVVIPTHGQRLDFLRATVDSVRRQTRPPHRIIVVVDGNAEAAARLRRESLGVDLLVHERPLGQAAARQTGIEAATSPWVAFVDDDDLWVRHKQEVLLAYVAEHPECKAVRAGYWTFSSRSGSASGLFGQEVELHGETLEELENAAARSMPRNDLEYLDILGDSLAMMLEFNRGVIGTTMVRRELLLQIPPVPVGLRPGDDHLLFCHIAAETEWHLVRARLEFYRLHDGQDSRLGGIESACNILESKTIAWKHHGSRNSRPLASYGPLYAEEVSTYAWNRLRARRLGDARSIWSAGRPLLPRRIDRLRVLIPPPLLWRSRRVIGRRTPGTPATPNW